MININGSAKAAKAVILDCWNESSDDSTDDGITSPTPGKKLKFEEPEFLTGQEEEEQSNHDSNQSPPSPNPFLMYNKTRFCEYCTAFECPLCKMERIVELHEMQQDRMDMKFKMVALRHQHLWFDTKYDMQEVVAKHDPDWAKMRDNQRDMERDCALYMTDTMERIKNVKKAMERWEDCDN